MNLSFAPARLLGLVATSVTTVVVLSFSATAFAADPPTDPAAAESMVRQNGCFKCHSITKKKDGPAYHDVATKMKGDPGAEQRLITHITSGEKAKFPDGHEEAHKIIKTKDPKELKNVVDWILSL